LHESLIGSFNLAKNRNLPIENRKQTVNMEARSLPPMLVLDPLFLIGLAALISSLSAFVWAIRRRP